MPGRFSRVGDTRWPGGGTPPCGVYEWDPNDPRLGKFSIRFLSPDEPGRPRVYYVEPLLRLWLDGEPTRFLERACDVGHTVLAQLAPDTADDDVLHRLWRALFRNRHRGHGRVGRRFTCAIDFVDLGPGGPSLLTPGLGDDSRAEAPLRGGPHMVANQLLREALTRGGAPPRLAWCGLLDVVAAYRAMSKDTRPPGAGSGGACGFPLDEWPGRGGLDLLFTGGWARRRRRWDVRYAVPKVRSALIHGPVSAADQDLAVADRETFARFVAALRKAAQTRTPRAFDDWLGEAREHGYRPLVGGGRLRGHRREEAGLQARRLHGALLWRAYERLARCYGALMLVAYVDLCLSRECPPTPEERWLFRQYHFPQLYLAGLPLDFLETPQLRWVVPTLHELWGGLVVEPECYDVVTDLLGLYGQLAGSRREADRRRKAAARGRAVGGRLEQRRPRTNGTGALPGGPEDGDCRPLTSTSCPRCGDRLQPFGSGFVEDLGQSLVRVRLYCPGCDVDRDYVVDLDQLSGGLTAPDGTAAGPGRPNEPGRGVR
jgi:hypothetical protein